MTDTEKPALERRIVGSALGGAAFALGVCAAAVSGGRWRR